MPYTAQERRNILINSGYDPSQYDYNELTGNVVKRAPISDSEPSTEIPDVTTKSTQQLQKTTAFEAFKLNAKEEAFPAASGLMGAVTTGALAARFAPHPAVSIPATLIGAFGMSAGAKTLQDRFIIPQEEQEKAAKAREEQPIASLIGQLAPNLALGNIPRSIQSLSRLPSILSKLPAGQRMTAGELNILQNLALQSGIGTGIESVQQIQQGNFDPARLGLVAGLSALGTEPNRVGKFFGIPTTADIESAYRPRGGDINYVRGYLPPPSVSEPSTTLPRGQYPRDLPPYAIEGLPGISPTQEKVFNMPYRIETNPEWRKAKAENYKKQAELETAKLKADTAVKDKQIKELGSAIEPTTAVTPERVIAEQQKALQRRGIDIQYEPEVQAKGKPIAGEARLNQRLGRFSTTAMRPDLLPHEGGHIMVNDLKNSPSGKDKRLYRRLIELGITEKVRNKQALNANERGILERMQKAGATDDAIAEELMMREFGDVDYNRLKQRLEGKGKFSQWLGDVVANFKYKLGTSDTETVLRHLSARYQGDAPYGTRPDLLSPKTKFGGEKESGIPPTTLEPAKIPSLLLEEAREIAATKTGPEFLEAIRSRYGTKMTEASYRLGDSVKDNPEALTELETMRDTATADVRQALAEGRFEDVAALSTKPQFFIEALQRARGEEQTRTSEIENIKGEGATIPKEFGYPRPSIFEKLRGSISEAQMGLTPEKSLTMSLAERFHSKSSEAKKRLKKAAKEFDKALSERGKEEVRLVNEITERATKVRKESVDESVARSFFHQKAAEAIYDDNKENRELFRLMLGDEYMDEVERDLSQLVGAKKEIEEEVGDQFNRADQEYRNKAEEQLAFTRSDVSRQSEIEPVSEEQAKFAKPIIKGMESQIRESAFEKGKKVINTAKQARGEHVTEGEIKDYNEANKQYIGKIDELEAFTDPDKTRQSEVETQETPAERAFFVKSWASGVDKVRAIDKPTGDAIDKMYVRLTSQYQPRYRDVPHYDIRKLRLTDDEANNVVSFLRGKFRGLDTPELNNKESKAVKILQTAYKDLRETQNKLGLEVEQADGTLRKGKVSEHYIADMLSDESIQLFTKKAGSLEARAAIDEWAKYVEDQSQGRISFKDAKTDIEEYVAAIGGNKLHQIEFNALRRASGYGVPDSLREGNLYKIILKYGRRAARDLAYWQDLQSVPEVAAKLGLPKREGGVTKVEGVESIASNPDVQNAMRFVFNDFGFVRNPRLHAAARAVNNSLLGAGSGLRNSVSLPALMAPYLETSADMSAMWKGLLNPLQARRKSLEYGARSGTMDFDRWYSLEAPDKVTQTLNRWAEAARKYQGRDLLEQGDRIATFAAGQELAKNKILELENPKTAKAAEQWLEKMGTLARNEDGTWNVDQIAKNFTDKVQGTYDIRGLPVGAFDSDLAPFLSLSRWGIEKSNQLFKDVIQPARKGNFKPILTYTLGSFLTGVAIRELNEALSGRKDYTPSLGEAKEMKRPDYYTASLVNIMQMGSYFGFMSDLMKTGSDIFLQHEKPRGPINFPLADFITEIIGNNLADTKAAIDNGVDPAEAVMRFAGEVIRSSVQDVRLLESRVLSAEDTERSNKFRDIRVFDKLSGERAESVGSYRKSRINVTPEQEFRRESDLGKAAEMLPTLLQRAVEESKGDPYKLKQKLASLKQNNYQTMPSPETMPLEFVRFIQFLEKTQGPEAASDRLQDYFQMKAVNQAKSRMVP